MGILENLRKTGKGRIPLWIQVITSFSWVLLGFVRWYGGERGIRTLDRAFDPITVY
jgi:hypothetical protein